MRTSETFCSVCGITGLKKDFTRDSNRGGKALYLCEYCDKIYGKK